MHDKFELGTLCATSSVAERMRTETDFTAFVRAALVLYRTGDWGVLPEEDKELNNSAIINGERIMGAYIYHKTGEKIWIITEADRSHTTVLYPSKY